MNHSNEGIWEQPLAGGNRCNPLGIRRISAGAFSAARYSFCNRSSSLTVPVTEQARPKHLGFLSITSTSRKRDCGRCFSVEEAYSRREPVQNPKRRDFRPFECFDHTPLAEPLRPAKMKTL